MTLREFIVEIMPLKDKLFRFASRLLNDMADAEDVVQEVYLRLWAKRVELGQIRNMEAMAMTITKNLCIDLLRSKDRWNFEESDNSALIVEPMTPYDLIEMRDTASRINTMINLLPEQQRMIIHLRDVEGYDFDEIASILGLNLNVIRVNLSRARKRIKEQLIKVHQYELQRN
jgi:RNA polymerase sigma-70 factor (ECF subfamily)